MVRVLDCNGVLLMAGEPGGTGGPTPGPSSAGCPHHGAAADHDHRRTPPAAGRSPGGRRHARRHSDRHAPPAPPGPADCCGPPSRCRPPEPAHRHGHAGSGSAGSGAGTGPGPGAGSSPGPGPGPSAAPRFGLQRCW